jgi:hypothetical protein
MKPVFDYQQRFMWLMPDGRRVERERRLPNGQIVKVQEQIKPSPVDAP